MEEESSSSEEEEEVVSHVNYIGGGGSEKLFISHNMCLFSGEKSYVSLPLNLNIPPKDHLQPNTSGLEQALEICLPDGSLCPS